MSIVSSFAGAARSFLDHIDNTRRSLNDVAHRLTGDANYARAWGFLALARLGVLLTHRRRDALHDRESSFRAYAARAVQMTHALHDLRQIRAIEEDILADNLDGITVADLDDFLTQHIDTLTLHGYAADERRAMIAGVRRQQSVRT